MAIRRKLHVTSLVLLATTILASPARARQEEDDGPVDPVAELALRLEAGEVALSHDSAQGYLASLLEALEIPVSSQGLVFSRTSLQTDRIAPWSPRAIYFNDDVYVGFVQESPILEIASIDPDDGAVFYTLSQDETQPPTFVRETTTCLMCHDSRSVTGGVPGVMVRSTLTDRLGNTIIPVHEGATTDRTEMSQRLGGWYVTGSVGTLSHAGNALAPELWSDISDPPRYLRDFDMTSAGKVTDLTERFSPEPYLSRHSDLVALLVLTHQTRVHNLITAAHESAREALREQEAILRSTGQEPPEDGLLPSSRIRIEGSVDRLLDAMLFVREAPLGGPISGSTSFAEDFSSRGPTDPQGRSLRDLDLERRLFRYPLSFLIYTDAFDTMPDVVKRMLYQRLDEVLRGVEAEDVADRFAHLGAEDRVAIREILIATKPEFLEMLGG